MNHKTIYLFIGDPDCLKKEEVVFRPPLTLISIQELSLH